NEREAGDRINCEAYHPGDRIFCLASEACISIINIRNLLHTNPAHHATDKTVVLWHVVEDDDGAPTHQPEISCLDWDLSVSQALEEAIECPRGNCLEKSLTFPRASLPINDFSTGFLHCLHHCRQ